MSSTTISPASTGLSHTVRGLTGCLLVGLLLLAIPVTVRALVFQPFDTPTGSQKPTLLTGEHFFVAKYAYGYSRYSLPFASSLFSGRVWAAEPQRGDMVVFKLPRMPSIDQTGRVVGLPGDRIQMIGGLLHINGEPVKRERMEDFVDIEDGRTTYIRQWRETLPNGVSYPTLDAGDAYYDNTPVLTVPAGHYFMMSDNRDHSTDSRELGDVGYVPFENLIGRVGMIFYSEVTIDPGEPELRFERIGTIVR